MTLDVPLPDRDPQSGVPLMRLTLTAVLPRRPSSVREARRLLDGLLSLVTADTKVRGDVSVLVTEACSNAVRHGDADTIDLHVAVEDGRCVLEVGNCGHVPDGVTLPAQRPEPTQLSGRGLPLITALAERAEFVPTAPDHVLLRMTVPLPRR
ncbi:hypothetical protein Val02_49100 [Virgisporangium aliadipatigenens]|uniref:Histidine kinase/HSP90-like ATPase domain-containing protein n=1 Tax=Virgisporangium aliadipatigenens TaxID=741659 RepID=A0A8J4DRT8_9ACTN|nr:ATP-binding protein [Virgisporangium aliadipatigenens]GIJ48024.1 hypothetical protein Val02_49100 [Virgisporangium aliadipatigenens]